MWVKRIRWRGTKGIRKILNIGFTSNFLYRQTFESEFLNKKMGMPSFVIELKNDLPVSEIGGKAYSLSVLLKNGFNVPQGFVVTSSAFFDFLKYNGLLEKIRKLALEINQDNFREKSKEANELILKGNISKEIASDIEKFLNRLDVKYLSLRSSAVSEDTLKASFAGLHDTFLNVKGDLTLVLENIKKCFASLFNDRAVAYRIKKKIPYFEGMAVIIQEMIPAEVSGVTFSKHPMDEKSLLIEASYGLGDIIVGGNVEPDDYTVNRKSLEITKKEIGKKNKMSKTENKNVERADVPEKLTGKQALSDEKIREIAQICLKIEKIFNYPQDIEWCISHSKLWLLQSRNITKVRT